LDNEICYATIGRDKPSTCESVGGHEKTEVENTEYVLPRIDEECTSVFSGSVTDAQMLKCITGHNSFSKSSEFVVDSGLSSGKDDDHDNQTVPHEQDQYISEKLMIHASSSPNIDAVQASFTTSVENETDYHLSITSLDSIVPSSNCFEEITSHPDYYTAAQRTTTCQMTSGCSNEVGQCSDHKYTIKHEGIVSEDGGVADFD